MTLRFTILGCGSSGGVPRIGNIWGRCDPANPKNRRRRCSLLVERWSGDAVTRVLVDTSPDVREQLLDADVDSLDGVVYTHDHADHIHGIDDLRVLFLNLGRKIDVWADARTEAILKLRFGYAFEALAGQNYPPFLTLHQLTVGRPFTIDGPAGPVEIVAFDQVHADTRSLGFRFGDVAYSSDLNDLPEASLPALRNLDVWIVDALRDTPHPTHFSVDDALSWIRRLGPRRAILTNMHIDLDYDTLRNSLPANIEPAFDGMVIKPLSRD